MPTDPKPLSTLLGELDALVQSLPPRPWHGPRKYTDEIGRSVYDEKGNPLALCMTSAICEGTVALVNAYPALKEGIERLERALKERTEALRDLIADLDLRAELKAMITGREPVVDASDSILAKARAVLATEGDDHA